MSALEVVSVSELWVSVGLPIGIAVVGLVGTVAVTIAQLRARRRELQDERTERESISAATAANTERAERAVVVEGVIDAISLHAAALSTALRSATMANTGPTERVPFPNDFEVKSKLSRISTRLGELEITSAALGMLAAGKERPLREQGYVYGYLQERLEMWHVGRRSTEATVAALVEDAGYIRSGAPLDM